MQCPLPVTSSAHSKQREKRVRRLLSAQLDRGIQEALFIECVSKDPEEGSQEGDSEGRKHLGGRALAFDLLIRCGESQLPKRSCSCRGFPPLSMRREQMTQRHANTGLFFP